MRNGLLAVLAFGLILSLSAALPRRVMRGTAFDCADHQFWNDDISKCLSCAICTNQSKTPGCQKCPRECGKGMFWNFDTERCVSCHICQKQPNTPQCHVCRTPGLTPTLGPSPVTAAPVWIWVLVAMVILTIPVTAVFAWLKARPYHSPEVAKPVQEIGVREEPEIQNLTSD